MKVVYVKEEIIKNPGEPLIFLAGPTPRSDDVKSWRPELIKALQDLNFNGTVLIPEALDRVWKNDYIGQVEWELEGLYKADLVVFWIPRQLPDMPAFTTNVEFGYCLGRSKLVIYGRPENTPNVNYLDYIHKKYSRFIQNKPYETIQDLAQEIYNFFNK